ncbi:MAG TPA: FGGY-family carbohydrate kinase [Terriglobales bacterium]|nr:FGGY-family carbohydrate kinase [Terriglobales bacterium]
MSLLAVDIGSSSCKAIAFSEEGHALAQKTCSYPPLQTPRPTWAEISAESFWQALTAATHSVAEKVPKDPVEVLAISSHGETIVPVDSRSQAVAPAILNMDNRAEEEANAIGAAFEPRRMYDITGLTVHPMYPLAKMLWLRKHQPDVFGKAARFLAVPTYLLTRLGLPAYVDYSLASRYLAFEIRRKTWSSEVLGAFELSSEQLPKAVAAGTVAGELSSAAAAQLGLRPGTLVVVGGHDQPCGALGCGVVQAGRVSASLGTYECLVAASREPASSDGALNANLNSYCHVVPDRYITLAYFPAGIMLEWFLRVLCSSKEVTADDVGELCRNLEANCSQGPSGLLITPHLLGTCNPDFNPHATGVISGIRPGTSRTDLYKAILEGIACEFANLADLLQEAAGAFWDIYVTGGGTLSPLGLRLRAALSGRELHLTDCPDTVCLGTAMLAGLAADKYACFCEAAEQLVRVTRTITPDAGLAKSYEVQRRQYRLLYSSLAPVRNFEAQPN